MRQRASANASGKRSGGFSALYEAWIDVKSRKIFCMVGTAHSIASHDLEFLFTFLLMQRCSGLSCLPGAFSPFLVSSGAMAKPPSETPGSARIFLLRPVYEEVKAKLLFPTSLPLPRIPYRLASLRLTSFIFILILSASTHRTVHINN